MHNWSNHRHKLVIKFKLNEIDFVRFTESEKKYMLTIQIGMKSLKAAEAELKAASTVGISMRVKIFLF